MITLVFADSHPVVRAGIRTILSEVPDIQVVGEADNSTDVQRLVEQLRPQILLLDLKMRGSSTAEVIGWVHANFPETAMLILTAHDHDAYLASTMDAGVVGLLNTDVPAERLVGAIRYAAQGEILFDKEQLDRAERWRKVAGEKWASLSKRQKQILRLLAQGATRVEVAEQLGIHLRVVNYHIGMFLKRLKFKSLLATINWAHKYFPGDLGTIAG
jgi:DNA-binding NarL/FixJ family response regulator